MSGLSSKRRVTLVVKLNLLIISAVLIVSVGLLTISYYVQARQVDRFCFSLTERAALTAAKKINPDFVALLWEEINTAEFSRVREDALAAQNPELLSAWMKNRPSVYGLDPADISLYDDYCFLCDELSEIRQIFDLDSVYLQRDSNGVTFILADPDEDLLHLGSTESLMDVFEPYGDNVRIPPTVYRSIYGWLCTACEPIVPYGEINAVGLVGADVDMNSVIAQRRAFLLNSALLILVLTSVAILVNLVLIRRIVIRPLRKLQQGTSSFTKDRDAYTMVRVIGLEPAANDEIGDLYQEIRSMQADIVSYTGDLARISAEKERARTEMNLAAKIQRSVLPEDSSILSGREKFELAAMMLPAKDVGGDFYDFFLRDDTHLVFLIADVSGKGIPAALFMMSVKNLLCTRAAAGGTPAEIFSEVNAQLCAKNPAHMFVTVWMGILDLETGVITAANAGHEQPAIRGNDGIFRLLEDRHSFVIGGSGKTKFTEYEIHLEPGDAIFLYTDGVPEANDASGGFFEESRMVSALNTSALSHPKEILAEVLNHTEAFTAGAEQYDDLTMLCLQYKGPGLLTRYSGSPEIQ